MTERIRQVFQFQSTFVLQITSAVEIAVYIRTLRIIPISVAAGIILECISFVVF